MAQPRQRTLRIETEFIRYHQGLCLAETMVDWRRLYSLYQAVRHVIEHDLPGDLVECGVWRGGAAMMMALTTKARVGSHRDIYLYDTYAGMTEPTPEDVRPDGLHAGGKWRQLQRRTHNDWCYAPLDVVQQNMRKTGYDQRKLHFVKGPVEKTIPGTAPERIAVLRLDTDFYASTLHELEHLYPRLVPGGVIIFDDYNHWMGQRQATEEYFRAIGEEIELKAVTTSAIGVKSGIDVELPSFAPPDAPTPAVA
jgi:hypothetical protein